MYQTLVESFGSRLIMLRLCMTKILLLTKGHPFYKDKFFQIFDNLVVDDDSCVTEYTHVEQPAAQHFFDPDLAKDWDVFVMYDMPGIKFADSSSRKHGGHPVTFSNPSQKFIDGSRLLLEQGKGMIFLHHAIAGWPNWEEWADIIGGRFHYQPGSLHGVDYPDSGYRHNVEQTIEVVDPEHPIVQGIPSTFEFVDEAYLAPIFEDRVDPILRSNISFVTEEFYSTDLGIRGKGYTNENWDHPKGSNLVGWVKHAGNSPVAYLQFGDGPAQYAEPIYSSLINNAIAWAHDERSHEWARDRRESTGRFA